MGIGFESGHPAGFLLPLRPDAEQGERLGGVVAPGAHGRGSPQHEAHGAGRPARLGDVALDQGVGQLAADLPRQRRRERFRIDRVEVATGRQDMGAPSGRRPARPGRDVPAVQGVQDARQLIGRAGQIGHQPAGDPLQRRIGGR